MRGPNKLRDYWGEILFTFFFIALTPAAFAQTEANSLVQELSGQIEPANVVIYSLLRLRKGSTLFIYAKDTSGDFDPFVAVTNSKLKAENLRRVVADRLQQAVTAKENPQFVYKKLASDYFLAWNDDSKLHDSRLEFTIPADGDYRIILMSAVSNGDLRHFEPILTSGQYRLLIGIDSPEVLTGEAASKGAPIAYLDQPVSGAMYAVQKVTGVLAPPDRKTAFYFLRDFNAGDTLYVYVKATSGDLAPSLRLNDYSSKPLIIAEPKADESRCKFSYHFTQNTENCSLHISGESESGKATYGDFELLIGVNAPEVLTGNTDTAGPPIIKEPIKVKIGMRIQQITDVDQRSENFGIVGSLEMRWSDPELAFNPDDCKCTYRTFTYAEFVRYVEDKGTVWPAFTFYNQQGTRWSQNKLIVVFSSGEALYFERFSTTFQAPDFDFRRYPFDTQKFFIRVDSLYPEPIFMFEEMPGYTELGKVLGVEQWRVIKFETNLSTVYSSTSWPTSQFNIKILATRHIDYYVSRIFLPIFIILVVSWITFFSKDYDKRVDVASGNLLLFVAFNFVIANDLPRLGYLTFLDTVIVASFVLTSFGVIYNVILKRLEASGKHSSAQKIDRYLIWFYPLFFVVAIALLTGLFG